MDNTATIAFESIDGPPPHVFAKMVGLLDSESRSHNLSIVSRATPAAYRVRSYMSAQVFNRSSTVIAWVWDVYDRDGQRALRLSGEEKSGKIERDGPQSAWAAVDDAVLRRIAQLGLDGLKAVTSVPLPVERTPSPSTDPLPPRGSGPVVASADDADHGEALGFSVH